MLYRFINEELKSRAFPWKCRFRRDPALLGKKYWISHINLSETNVNLREKWFYSYRLFGRTTTAFPAPLAFHEKISSRHSLWSISKCFVKRLTYKSRTYICLQIFLASSSISLMKWSHMKPRDNSQPPSRTNVKDSSIIAFLVILKPDD